MIIDHPLNKIFIFKDEKYQFVLTKRNNTQECDECDIRKYKMCENFACQSYEREDMQECIIKKLRILETETF